MRSGLVRREAAVHLHQQLDVVADRVAHRFDERDRAQALGVVELEAAGPERIELQRAVAALDDARGPRHGTPRVCARPCTNRWRRP